MSLLTPGKLFLADQRGVLETSTFRRFSTFQFGRYVHAHKQPFGRLLALNEETLAGGHTVSLPVTEASYLLILPLTGEVWVGAEPGPAVLVDVAQLYVLSVTVGSTVQFTNPYATELISFLHLWLRGPVGTAANQMFAFDLDNRPNQLVAAKPLPSGTLSGVLPPNLPFQVQLGRFTGRAETACAMPEGTFFFAFVLAGAFELAGRLLHAGDGLALWDTPTVELEALSQEAVLITLTWAA
jgi:hypothetical protein